MSPFHLHRVEVLALKSRQAFPNSTSHGFFINYTDSCVKVSSFNIAKPGLLICGPQTLAFLSCFQAYYMVLGAYKQKPNRKETAHAVCKVSVGTGGEADPFSPSVRTAGLMPLALLLQPWLTPLF